MVKKLFNKGKAKWFHADELQKWRAAGVGVALLAHSSSAIVESWEMSAHTLISLQ